MAELPRVIAAAKEHAPAYRRLLAKVRPEDVTDRRALVDLPLTRKSDLIGMQQRDPPFGGLNAAPVMSLARLFSSPGPIYEVEGRPRGRAKTRDQLDQEGAGRRRGVSVRIAQRVPRARHHGAAMLRHRRSRPDRV